jgi:hypothetical protein
LLLAFLPVSYFLLRATPRTAPSPSAAIALPHSAAAQPPLMPEVWQVEQSGTSEAYSNGLRIDNRFAVSNHPRAYRTFPASGRSTQPAGIVFHTTESRQVPFAAEQNRMLQRLGEGLLEYVQRRRSYNFLIDRFGRVYRVVRESDAANHAGFSVWADDRSRFVDLNESFLGVALEAHTEPGQTQPQLSPAQTRAAAMLTEMLRSRYKIAAGNCVTHAQVSVNPSNMLVGYHTDWASSFPFESLGLPDNYALPLPAMWAFGFESDPSFSYTAGSRMAASVGLAQEGIEKAATQSGVSTKAYRAMLRKRYGEELAATRATARTPSEESE